MKKLELLAGAEPFYYPGGPLGCLLLHGFTGMPYEMRPLGDCLAEQGHTILAPRLTHHGTQPADLNRSHWQDWYFAALDAYHLLRGQCRQVVVMGLSMGGATALLLAAQQQVDGVVAMSVPIRLPSDWRFRILPIIGRVRPLMPKDDGPEAEPLVPSYPVYPVLGGAQLLDYLKVVDQALPQVTAPALLLHARNDGTAPPDNLDYIYDRLGATDKQKFWIERGDHVVTADVDRDVVCRHVLAFLQERFPEATNGHPAS